MFQIYTVLAKSLLAEILSNGRTLVIICCVSILEHRYNICISSQDYSNNRIKNGYGNIFPHPQIYNVTSDAKFRSIQLST